MAGATAPTAGQLVQRGGGRQAMGTPTGTGGGVKRRAVGSSGAKQRAQTNYYTDDTPGLKISPVVVIGMSITFILVVTVFHIVGKVLAK